MARTSFVAPAATVTALAELNALALTVCITPDSTVTFPVKAALATSNLTCPVPASRATTTSDAPVIPAVVKRSAVAPETSRTALFKVIPPLMIVVPLSFRIVAVPLLPDATVIGLASVSPAPCRVAFALPELCPSVTAPVPLPPSAFALVVALTVPSRTTNPPLNVFAPLKVSMPLPVLTSPSVPLTAPPNAKFPLAAFAVTVAPSANAFPIVCSAAESFWISECSVIEFPDSVNADAPALK